MEIFLFYIEKFLSFLDRHSSGIIAISSILAVIFGSSWLDTSKRKLRGKLHYDIARKYLRSVLKLRDAIKIVRSPIILGSEIEFALEKAGVPRDKFNDNTLVNQSVYSLRWEKVLKAWTNFEEILTEAEVSWGDGAVDIQNGLDGLIKKLRSIVWLFVNHKESFNDKKFDENNKILRGTHDENDEFSEHLNREINKIRSFLQKYL